MYMTQGTFSFLPALSDEQIEKQCAYCIDNGWALSLEHTDDPRPENSYWEMFGHPMFDNPDPKTLMVRLYECRLVFPHDFIKVVAFDNTHGWETIRLSFIVHRPSKGLSVPRDILSPPTLVASSTSIDTAKTT